MEAGGLENSQKHAKVGIEEIRSGWKEGKRFESEGGVGALR